MNISQPSDLLVAIPAILHREPEEVMVLVTFKDGRIQALMGLEHCTDMGNMPEYIHGLIEELAELRPEAIACIYYTEAESECEHDPMEHVHVLIELTLDTLTPVIVAPGILVKGGRFKQYQTDHWHDMSELKSTPLAAEMVLQGLNLTPPGVVIPEPASATEEVTEAIDEASNAVPHWKADYLAAWRDPWMTDMRALWDELLGRGYGATQEEAVRLIGALQRPFLRDRMLVDTLLKTDDMDEFGRVITGHYEFMIDRPRVEAACALLDNLMQWTVDRHRVTLLVMQGWMYWVQGRSMDAVVYLDAALAIDPDCRLASLFRNYIKELKRMPDGIATEGRQA